MSIGGSLTSETEFTPGGARFAAQGISPSFAQRRVPKGLDLLQFTTGLMAKTGTGPAEVVRRERWNLTALGFLLHHTPNSRGAEAGAFGPSRNGRSAKVRPARHHHHERPSHTTPGSRRNLERAAKRGPLQLRSQTASACRNQYRWKGLRAKVPGTRRGPSS